MQLVNGYDNLLLSEFGNVEQDLRVKKFLIGWVLGYGHYFGLTEAINNNCVYFHYNTNLEMWI